MNKKNWEKCCFPRKAKKQPWLPLHWLSFLWEPANCLRWILDVQKYKGSLFVTKNNYFTLFFPRQNKLEEALLFSGQFTDALQALIDWLYRVEPQLAEDQPVHGDIDLVMNLIDNHKVRLSRSFSFLVWLDYSEYRGKCNHLHQHFKLRSLNMYCIMVLLLKHIRFGQFCMWNLKAMEGLL